MECSVSSLWWLHKSIHALKLRTVTPQKVNFTECKFLKIIVKNKSLPNLSHKLSFSIIWNNLNVTLITHFLNIGENARSKTIFFVIDIQ